MPTTLIDQVRAYCLSRALFEPGSVVVGVSGGADSLSLLHVLLALRGELRLALHVATFDHQIRGPESADDCRFVCDIADDWGVPVTAGAANIPALTREWSLGLEAAARKARYAFLADVARQIGAAQIALGHNQDDQAETVLMHVIRGAGLAGLRGMLPKTPLTGLAAGLTIVRPLLDIPRTTIDMYLRERGIQPRTDRTNADRSYTRNRIRHDVMPLLEAINPQARAALARTGDLAREDYDALHSLLPPLEKDRIGLSISRARFLDLPAAQQRLWLRLAAQQLAPGLELDYDRTVAAVSLIGQHSHGARMLLGEHLWLRIASDSVTIFDETAYPADCPWMEPHARLIIEGEGTFTLPGGAWRLGVRRSQATSISLDPLTAFLAIGDGERLELRTRTAGDRFRPHGAAGHVQKLSDTFINMKIPAHWRDRVPLLVAGNEIAWFVAPTPEGPKARVAEFAAVRQDDRRSIWRFDFRPA